MSRKLSSQMWSQAASVPDLLVVPQLDGAPSERSLAVRSKSKVPGGADVIPQSDLTRWSVGLAGLLMMNLLVLLARLHLR